MHNRKEYLRQLLQAEKWTDSEREWLLHYLDENELSELEEVAAAAYYDDNNTAVIPDRRVSEQMLEKIHRRIQPKRSFTGTIYLYRKSIAVAAVLLIAAGIGYINITSQRGMKKIATLHERKILRLPDSSLVFLEPGSTLTYPEKFGKNAREVSLTGEAFFDVNHDAQHPFTISSSLISTTVLGTSFNMEVRKEDIAKVVVVSGMVQVQTKINPSSNGAKLVITANKSAVYNRNTNALELKDAASDARFFSQKRNGKFVYKGVPLAAVVNDLQHLYNTPVTLDEKMHQCSFYGDYSTEDGLDKVLMLIAITLNAKINKDSNSNAYTITGGSCK